MHRDRMCVSRHDFFHKLTRACGASRNHVPSLGFQHSSPTCATRVIVSRRGVTIPMLLVQHAMPVGVHLYIWRGSSRRIEYWWLHNNRESWNITTRIAQWIDACEWWHTIIWYMHTNVRYQSHRKINIVEYMRAPTRVSRSSQKCKHLIIKTRAYFEGSSISVICTKISYHLAPPHHDPHTLDLAHPKRIIVCPQLRFGSKGDDL